MDIQSFEQLVRIRQSCRLFSQRKVEKEKIDKILQLTLLSPSACNSQPWSFIVLTYSAARAAADSIISAGGGRFVASAPAFVAIIEEDANLKERLGDRFKGQNFSSIDIGIAAAHLVLSAKACGVDSCILGCFNEDEIKRLLKLDQKRVRLLVALGHAEDGYPVRKKIRKDKGAISYLE